MDRWWPWGATIALAVATIVGVQVFEVVGATMPKGDVTLVGPSAAASHALWPVLLILAVAGMVWSRVSVFGEDAG